MPTWLSIVLIVVQVVSHLTSLVHGLLVLLDAIRHRRPRLDRQGPKRMLFRLAAGAKTYKECRQ